MKLKIDFEIAQNELAQTWPSFFMLGSCFAQNQAERMAQLGFDVLSNPFGIIYNPVSIQNLLQRISNNTTYTETDFNQRNTVFSWEHHGDFKYSGVTPAVETSNVILTTARQAAQKADVILLTLGTSLVHTHNDIPVANCHKIANHEFEQKQLTFDETKTSIEHSISLIKQLNPTASIIITVSPVRHLRSGIIENSRSKAVLLAALHEVLRSVTNVTYFPSYELFIDELRDYRFAKEDMTHPTPQAETYIWDRFCETYFTATTRDIIEHVKKYNLFAAHRPIHSANEHVQKVAEKRNTLQLTYPFLKIK